MRNYSQRALVIFVLLTWPMLISAQEGGQTPTIVINEVMWVGSTKSSSDEWLELYNTTPVEIDISGWTIDNAASKQRLVTVPDHAIIPAGGYFVLAHYEAGHDKAAFAMATTPVVPTGNNISLANDGNGDLVLRDVGQNKIDAVLARFSDQGEGSSWPVDKSGSGADKIRKSMERNSPTTDGLLLASWHLSSTSADQINFGTPGASNSIPVVNQPPQAVLSGAGEVAVGDVAEFTGEDSFDLDGDELTYSWSVNGITLSTDVIFEHAFDHAGEYNLTLTVSDGVEEDRVSSTVTAQAPVYTDDIVINELLPDPFGLDQAGEFVELYNTGSSLIDLSGWLINNHAITDGTQIGGQSWLVFKRNEINFGSLVNGGGTIDLKDPNSETRSFVTYSLAPTGQSYNRSDSGDYAWSTTTTPGKQNVITQPDEKETEDEDSQAEGTSGSVTSASPTPAIAGVSIKKVELKNVRREPDGARLKVEGIVSVPPDVLSGKYMYLSGSGIQVYFSQADWPEISLGDRVSLTGELSSARGEARLKLATINDITIIAAGQPPVPHSVKTGVISEEWEGSLVTVAGFITSTSGNTFYVDDGSGAVKVYIKSTTAIDKPRMSKGMAVTVTGVVSETSTGYRVLPRWQEDVQVSAVSDLTSFPVAGQNLFANRLLTLGRQGAITMPAIGLSVYLLVQARKKREPLIRQPPE